MLAVSYSLICSTFLFKALKLLLYIKYLCNGLKIVTTQILTTTTRRTLGLNEDTLKINMHACPNGVVDTLPKSKKLYSII